MLPINTIFSPEFSLLFRVFTRSYVACLFIYFPLSPLPLANCRTRYFSRKPFFPPRRAAAVRSNGGLASGRFKGFVKYDVLLKRRLFDRGNEFPTCSNSNNVTWYNATCQVGEQKHFQFVKWRFLGISKQWIVCGFLWPYCVTKMMERGDCCSVCVRSSG